MKKYLITLLGVIFLLPAFAYAGSYCVSFPESGGSKWTKRDNTAGVRFRYDYEREKETAGKIFATDFSPAFFAATGVLDGSGNTSRLKHDYTYYRNGTRDLCLEDSVPTLSEVSYSYSKNVGGNAHAKIRNPVAIKVRLDVKWGGDCGEVPLTKDGISGDHRFQLYRRKGDLVNPWGCRRK